MNNSNNLNSKENPNITVNNKKRKSDFSATTKVIIISVAFSLLAGVLGGILVLAYGSKIQNSFLAKIPILKNIKINNQNTSNCSNIEENKKVVVQEESAVVDVIKKASPAVVSIVITKDLPKYRDFFYDPFFNDFLNPFFGTPPSNDNNDNKNNTEKRKIGGGSGFIISQNGMIVTNKHVVEDKEADYTVVTSDGKEYKATVLARHPYLDVAILKIKGKNFPTLNLGDSDKLEVGQTAIAIGNPLGEFANSASLGIVSGLKRNIEAGSGFGQTEKLNNIIQTDAAINPGNSGGPLLNIQGKVIGINVAVAEGAENIGFALPINSVKKTIEQVEKQGKIVIPFLGVRYVIVNKEIQKENNLPHDYGALIMRGRRISDLAIVPGSPADKAGLVENDIILEVNGQKVTNKNSLSDIINRYNVGDEITLKVWHKGTIKQIKVKLEARK